MSTPSDYRRAVGAARIRLEPDAYNALRDAGTLVRHPHRSLPLPFDGRFFNAQDWTREQSYFLRRQADLGRALGAGVAAGLEVTLGERSTQLVVSEGHGVTPAGEMVALDAPATIDLENLSLMRELAQALGLSGVPAHPAQTRTGLFVVGLRPVEYTDNDITSYPQTLDGPRSLRHGDVIEGVVLTLLPMEDSGSVLEGVSRQGSVARRVFTGQVALGPPEVLPLAVVSLNVGVVDWLDVHLARRELTAQDRDVLGFGQRPFGMRAAQLKQYLAQLDAEIERRGGSAASFSASHVFDVLPPAGRLPRGSITLSTMQQSFFPRVMPVHVGVVPDDELPLLLEDAMQLPPIDLQASEEVLATTDVMVLAAVSRPRQQRLLHVLPPQQLPRLIGASAKGFGSVASLAPRQLIDYIRDRQNPVEPTPEEAASTQSWQDAIADAEQLWYVRLRTRANAAEDQSVSVAVRGEEGERERVLTDRLRELQVIGRYSTFKRKASAEADLDAVRLLSRAEVSNSPLAVRGAIEELLAKRGTVSGVDTVPVAERYIRENFGEGIAKLERVPGIQDPEVTVALARAAVVPELDELAAKLSDAQVTELAQRLRVAARAQEPEEVRRRVLSEVARFEQELADA